MIRNKNYVYGPQNSVVPVNLNFGEYVLEKLMQYEDRVAFIDAHTHEKITYSEIIQNGVNLAVSLAQLGVRKGDVIAVCSENRREFWPTFLGTIFTGAIFTPISITYSNDEIKHTLSISKPKYIFCSPLAYQTHPSAINSQKTIKKIIFYGEKGGLLYSDLVSKNVDRTDFLPVDVEGQNDVVVILYSSGTTGLPKGVLLTHYNAVAYCALDINAQEYQPEMTSISLAPWYHAFGLWGNLGGMVEGRTKVFIRKFSEQLFLETIQRYKPLTLSVVPPVLVLLSKSQILARYDVSSVHVMFCGAAPLDIETINDVKKRFPNLQAVIQGYGMTESTLAITVDSVDSPPGKQGSVGVATPGTVIKIVDPETRSPLGPHQPGEICIKSPLIMKGYIGRSRSEDFDDEGFYRSGDIGYYDEDRYFYIVDRLKELIKYKGFQVPPAELEAELLKHPAVRDAGVVGIPDKAAGELPLAFIVTQPGAQVTAEEIQAYAAEKLSNAKHLRGGVRFVNEIPKNPSGKIIRRLLRNMAKNGKSKL